MNLFLSVIYLTKFLPCYIEVGEYMLHASWRVLQLISTNQHQRELCTYHLRKMYVMFPIFNKAPFIRACNGRKIWTFSTGMFTAILYI